MRSNKLEPRLRVLLGLVIVLVLFTTLSGYSHHVGYSAPSNGAPVPLLISGHPVDWWFVFKFNSKTFPGCGGSATRRCPFGGTVQNYDSLHLLSGSHDRLAPRGRAVA
jgi:hypothetical protein